MNAQKEKYLTSGDVLDLYRNNLREILAFVAGYIKNDEDAEDAIQDIFFKLHEDVRKRKIFNINARAYLYKTARNYCIDIIRKKSSKHQSFVEFETMENIPNGNGENGLIDSILLDSIYEYIEAELPEKESTVFKLKYYYRLNLEEISEITDISVSTLSRILAKIVRKIEEKFPDFI